MKQKKKNWNKLYQWIILEMNEKKKIYIYNDKEETNIANIAKTLICV